MVRLHRLLLALLLAAVLVLASQAAAKGKKGGDDRDGGREGGDAEEDGDQEADPHGSGHAKRTRHGHHEDPVPSLAKRPGGGLAGDASLRILATPTPGALHYSFIVTRIGTGRQAVDLAARLPEIGAGWTMDGPGARGCTLAQSGLSCSFSALLAGDAELVQVHTALAQAPGWEPLASGRVSSANDLDPSNDQATASAGLLLF